MRSLIRILIFMIFFALQSKIKNLFGHSVPIESYEEGHTSSYESIVANYQQRQENAELTSFERAIQILERTPVIDG